MSLSLADQYYLKAVDAYEYGLEDAVEYLKYALSYQPGHADANCLMGRIYMERLQKFDLAEDCLVTSMASEPDHIAACEYFTELLIRTRRYREAVKLIKYGLELRGADISRFLRLEALIHEVKKDYELSRKLLKQAIEACFNSDYIDFLNNEINRVTEKNKMKKQTM